MVTNSSTDDTFSNNADPVFILSTERSGSNLIRSILGTHSDVSAPHPLETAYPWGKVSKPSDLDDARAYKLLRDILINKHYSYHPLDISIDVDRVFQRYRDYPKGHSLFEVQRPLYDEYASEEDTRIWVSKYPALWDCLEELFEYYDDPKIVYNVRDARDVVLSFKTSNVGQYHPYFNATRWQEEQRQGIDLLEERDDAVHQIRYKDLLQDPESVTRGMCEFLSLPFQPEMLYYYETDQAQTASESAGAFENLSSPVMSDNYDKFTERLPDEEVRLTEKIACEQLDYFGYRLTHSPSELDAFDIDRHQYVSNEETLSRKAIIDDWRTRPREQMRRNTTVSFAAYMIFRYGVFG